MKFFIATIFLASVLAGSQAVITRPDEVLAKINELEGEVFNYQSEVQEKIKSFRVSNGELTGEYYNKTLNIVEENIKSISVSDSDIRKSLAAQKQTSCIFNLVNFIDQIVELSGYAISNCIELKETGVLSVNNEFRELLDSFERDVDILSQIIINALIGRNIFTEGTAIIERVQEQLKTKTAEFDAVLTALNGQSTGVSDSWNTEISSLATCFADINDSLKSGVESIEAQIPVCIKFSGRGARSAPVLPFRPTDFFPQLK